MTRRRLASRFRHGRARGRFDSPSSPGGCLLLVMLASVAFTVEVMILSWPVRLAAEYVGADLGDRSQVTTVRVGRCERTLSSLGLLYSCRLERPVSVSGTHATSRVMRSKDDLTGRTLTARVHIESSSSVRYPAERLVVVPVHYDHASRAARWTYNVLIVGVLIAAVYLPYRGLVFLSRRKT